MSIEIEMPRLGESIEEATVLSFFKKEGEQVQEGEPIIEIATDKVDSEIVAPCSGIIEKIFVTVNEVVEIGKVLLSINSENTNNSEKQERKRTEVQKHTSHFKQSKKIEKQVIVTTEHTKKDGEIFLSPLVLSIAKTENISMEEVREIEGTGTNGRIRKSDIIKYIKNRPPLLRQNLTQKTPANGQTIAVADFKPPNVEIESGKDSIIPMGRMREMIAKHMVYSKNTAPHVTC